LVVFVIATGTGVVVIVVAVAVVLLAAIVALSLRGRAQRSDKRLAEDRDRRPVDDPPKPD
jgi:Flp pilus assembly protein TadB